ncbi:MAG: alpha/beta fold hydrolase [Christensenellales bacterium]
MRTQSVFRTEEGQKAIVNFEEGVMAYWPFPYTAAMVPTRFGQTHTVTAGNKDKPALVLLHGAASNLLGWGGDIPRYMDRFFVVAPDIPGEAGKSEPVRPSWSNDDYADWLCGLLDSLGIEEVCLLGISLGGWIALKFAAAYPARVKKLVLVTPAGIVPARASAVIKTVLYASQKDGARKMKRMVFGTDDILPVLSQFFDLILRHYVPRFGSPSLLRDDAIRGIQAKVQMVSGDKDAFFAVKKAARRLERLLPAVDIEIIPAGQHGLTEPHQKTLAFLRGGE